MLSFPGHCFPGDLIEIAVQQAAEGVWVETASSPYLAPRRFLQVVEPLAGLLDILLFDVVEDLEKMSSPASKRLGPGQELVE